VLLRVQNSRTELYHTDPFILHILDQELRYPTQMVQLLESGISLPDDAMRGWDGWVRLLHQPKAAPAWVPSGLLDRVCYFSRKFGYEVRVEDLRIRPVGDVPDPVKIPLRDYQLEAVSLAVERGMGVLDLPPRSGKTRVMCEITRRLALPTIWIAPTDRIVQQTQEVLEDFFGAHYSVHLIGSAGWLEASRKRVVIATAATAANLPAAFYASRKVIAVDEHHHSAAASYRKIFSYCDHIYHRYGMTGTYFRSAGDALAMHAVISGTIYKATSEDMLGRGWLVPVKAIFIPVAAGKIPAKSANFFSEHGKKGIHEHSLRNQWAAYAAHALLSRGRKVLILVGTKAQGKIIRELLLRSLPQSPDRAEFQAAEFVSTDIDRSRQGRIMRSFSDGAEVKVLLGTSILGEGVDLPAVDALVYAKGEKAEVSLTQAIYRICTAIEGKSEAVLIDFADRHHKKLLAHAMERLRIYYEEPIFRVEVMRDARSFVSWVEGLAK
jgi:superfamily II DNA or RNA helicase